MTTPSPISNGGLRIIELQVENIKRLKAVHLKPNRDINIITGQNDQGKSSVIDSIAYALGGKDLCPAKPIRRGQTSAKVIVDLDKYRVERRFTFNKEKQITNSQLYITGKEGESFRSPQAILDDLVGDLSFDPGKFMTLDPKDRLKMLIKLTGVTIDDLNDERALKYVRRTEIGRIVKQREAVVRELPHHPEAPIKEIDAGDLATRLQSATEHNDGITKARDAIAKKSAELSAAIERVQAIEAAGVFAHDEDLNKQAFAATGVGLALYIRREGAYLLIDELRRDLQDDLDHTIVQRDALSRQKLELEGQLEAYIGEQGDTIDTQALFNEHREAESVNRQVRENRLYLDKKNELDAAVKEVEELTARLEAIEVEKHNRLALVEFPVPGLSFNDDGVTFNDVPLEQASSAVLIRVSFGMALAMNKDKRLKICLIRNGSLLDDKNLAVVEEMAKEAGCQVWIERVADGGASAIVIEDGEVKEVA